MRRLGLVLLSCLFITACETTTNYAPVVDANIEPIPKSGMHKVARGESLYEVAWRYGMDYRALAVKNNISAPYSIRAGQWISLRKSSIKQQPTPIIKSKVVTIIKPPAMTHEPNFASEQWIWPAQGRIILGYTATNKGINIAGNIGQSIVAAAPGKVVYAGSGLRGYGKLIIIKHNALYLSAYAHNQRVFVQEGAWVKQGQKIAEMGNSGSDNTMLHFEIRRAGKPIDPITILQSPTNSRYNSIW